MDSIKRLTSLQNSDVKRILLLKEKSRERRKTERFVIDGLRELQLAINADYDIETIFFEPQLQSLDELKCLFSKKPKHPVFVEVSKEIYHKIAYRETTEGVVAIAHTKPHLLQKLNLASKAPLILVAEAPEKPGNIGALLRTADAANLDAVLIANPKTDMYNPNIIRSSVGGVFTTNIAIGTTEEILSFLKAKHIRVYCAALSASKNYVEVNYEKACAIVVGTESVGLSNDWLKKADQNIKIPMNGQIDSLNVSVSAAILIFEALRQKNYS